MSSAADLILPAPGDAQAIVACDYPLGKFKGVSVDGLDPLKVAALHWVLVHKALKDILREYHPVAQASPEGPWLVRVPDELIAVLGKIAPTDQASVAAKWASSRQALEGGWSRSLRSIWPVDCLRVDRVRNKIYHIEHRTFRTVSRCSGPG